MWRMQREMCLKRIQQIEFMAVELNLYLDTHPQDKRALMQYNHYYRELFMLKKHYEQMFGPLLGYGMSPSPHSWKWIYEPWPWEQDCEGVE